jgi:hypothetical protein
MTPQIVTDAFLVEPIDICGISLQPLTSRRWLRLEAAGSPFVDGDAPDDPEERIMALVQAVRILADKPSFSAAALVNVCPPGQVEPLMRTVLTILARGWSTVLPMHQPPKPGEASGGRLADHIGTIPRLIANAMHNLGMSFESAMDMPLCQLFVLTAAAEALAGKVPVKGGYK